MSSHRHALCLLTIFAINSLSRQACAIGHYFSSGRYYVVEPTDPNYTRRGGEVAPADLLSPRDIPMTNQGSFVSPRWIVGVHHNVGNPVKVFIPKQLVNVAFGPGFYEYDFLIADDIFPVPPALVTGDNYHLLKLASIGARATTELDVNAPAQIDLDTLGHRFFRMSDKTVGLTTATLTGVGNASRDVSPGVIQEVLNSRGGLRWGHSDPIGDGNQLKYKAIRNDSDSGAGAFVRNGLDWELLTALGNRGDYEGGTFNSWFDSISYDNSFSAISSATPKQGVVVSKQNIIDALQAKDPAAVAAINSLPQATASPTRYWDGSSDSSWHTVGYNWVDVNGAYSPVPRYDTVADTVVVNVPSGPIISGAAVAQDLLIGKGGQTAASASISSGSLTLAGLFLAQANSQKGRFTLDGGMLSTQQTIVGLNGAGMFIQNGGTHKVESLAIGGSTVSGAASRYELNAGSVNARETVIGARGTGESEMIVAGTPSSFSSLRLQIGADGAGTFNQSGGESMVIETDIRVGSKMSLTGGRFVGTTVSLSGSMNALGGAIAVGNLDTQPGSVLDFQGAGTSITFERGLVDLSDSTFANYGPGASIRVSNALLTVPTSAGALLNNGIAVRDSQGNVVTDLSSVPVHVAGSTAVIRNGNTVIGFGAINDRVDVSQGATLVAGSGVLASQLDTTPNGHLTLTNGLSLSDDSVVDLGAKGGSVLTIPSGRQNAAQASVINTGMSNGPLGKFVGRDVILSPQGKLVASGERFFLQGSGFAIHNGGQFEIGTSTSGSETAFLRVASASGIQLEGGVDSYGAGSAMVFDIKSTGHDQLKATRLNLAGFDVIDGGTPLPREEHSVIQLDIPVADVSSFQFGDAFELVNLDTDADGQVDNLLTPSLRESLYGSFRSVRYGGDSEPSGLLEPAQSGIATLQNFMNPDGIPTTHDGKAIAIVYADQFVGTGPFVGHAIVDPSMGVSAVIAIPGDANLDGVVDQLDFSVVANSFNETGTWADGDFNGDGIVNQLDYSTVASYWGQSDDYGGGIGGVPEPAASTLLLTSLAAVAVRRRRSK